VHGIGGVSARKWLCDEDHNAADHVLRCAEIALTTGSSGMHRGESVCLIVGRKRIPLCIPVPPVVKVLVSQLELTTRFLASAMSKTRHDAIRAYYRTLFSAWGRQHWWPAQSRFEMIVGAYLTQNTAWTNVEKALRNLRKARLLTICGIRRTPQPELEPLIRPAGYFRQKAQRLKIFVSYLDAGYGGSLARMFARPTAELRDELLALHGVGPETADSILLYAGNHPVFVVDAYTRRILERHRIVAANASYEEIRQLFEQALGKAAAAEGFSPPRRQARRENPGLNLKPGGSDGVIESPPYISKTREVSLGVSAVNKHRSGPRGSSHPPSAVSEATRSPLVQVFNEMHGLLVGVGKDYCLKSQMQCEQCPLRKFLPEAK
jgi:endonuclease III related protein